MIGAKNPDDRLSRDEQIYNEMVKARDEYEECYRQLVACVIAIKRAGFLDAIKDHYYSIILTDTHLRAYEILCEQGFIDPSEFVILDEEQALEKYTECWEKTISACAEFQEKLYLWNEKE